MRRDGRGTRRCAYFVVNNNVSDAVANVRRCSKGGHRRASRASGGRRNQISTSLETFGDAFSSGRTLYPGSQVQSLPKAGCRRVSVAVMTRLSPNAMPPVGR